jgi:hypothetical protein
MKSVSDLLSSVLGAAHCIKLGGEVIYQSLLAFRQLGRQMGGDLVRNLQSPGRNAITFQTEMYRI